MLKRPDACQCDPREWGCAIPPVCSRLLQESAGGRCFSCEHDDECHRYGLKAWHVFDGDPYESSLLVFASTRSKARWLAYRKGPWEYDAYIHISARRAPQWDAYADGLNVIETNSDLPVGAPPFYDDDPL